MAIYRAVLVYTENYKSDTFIFIAEYGRFLKYNTENHESAIFSYRKIADKLWKRQQIPCPIVN